jgi:integrase
VAAALAGRIHDLRHTAAYLWLSLGVDVVTVQAWMGHATIPTTNLSICTTRERQPTGLDWPV